MNNFQRKEIYDVTIGFSSLRQGECEIDLSNTPSLTAELYPMLLVMGEIALL